MNGTTRLELSEVLAQHLFIKSSCGCIILNGVVGDRPHCVPVVKSCMSNKRALFSLMRPDHFYSHRGRGPVVLTTLPNEEAAELQEELMVMLRDGRAAQVIKELLFTVGTPPSRMQL